MAWSSNGTSAEFSAGVNHLANAGRANDNSLTLGAGISDQGLDSTSARWSDLTPHGVLTTTAGTGSQDDNPWERLQRDSGGYAPGSMARFQDQLDQGTDNTA